MTFAACAATVLVIATVLLLYSLLRGEADNNTKPQHLEDQPGWRDALNQTGEEVDDNVFAFPQRSAPDTDMSQGAKEPRMNKTQNTGPGNDE